MTRLPLTATHPRTTVHAVWGTANRQAEDQSELKNLFPCISNESREPSSDYGLPRGMTTAMTKPGFCVNRPVREQFKLYSSNFLRLWWTTTPTMHSSYFRIVHSLDGNSISVTLITGGPVSRRGLNLTDRVRICEARKCVTRCCCQAVTLATQPLDYKSSSDFLRIESVFVNPLKPHTLTISNCILPTTNICRFRAIVTMNNDYFSTQH
jgi:hypothetical protein